MIWDIWDIVTYVSVPLVGLYFAIYGVRGLLRKEIVIMDKRKIGDDARKSSILVILGGISMIALSIFIIIN